MKKLFRRLFPSKEWRTYNKMHRKHRKELIKHVKETSEWDWHWLHESILMQIKHMHEYYTAGNNVWQADESRFHIIKQLKHVLDLQTEIEKTQEDDCGAEHVYDQNGELVKINFPDDFLGRLHENEIKEQRLYETLYRYIGEHIQEWWD